MRTPSAQVFVLALLALLAVGCAGATDRLTTHGAPPGSAVPSALPATSAPLPPILVPVRPLPTPTGSATGASGTGTILPAGTATARTATASPVRVSAAPPPANPAHLTESDSGQTVRIRVGEDVSVELPGGPSGGYHQPLSSSDIMKRTSASGGYPTDQPARASFVATRVGTAELTSYDDFACLHSDPRCLPAQREWIVHVIVQ